MMLIWGGLKKEIKRLKQGFNSNLVRFGEGGMEKVWENFTSGQVQVDILSQLEIPVIIKVI